MTTHPNAMVYRSLFGTPRQNLKKTIDLAGGIQRLVDEDDIVVIKPNVQWWNQGAPNIAAAHELITLIFNRPGGFHGEVVLAENTHRGAEPWNHDGWAALFERNADPPNESNYNELCRTCKREYGPDFTLCHWINVKNGGKKVTDPGEGPGYVFCDGTAGNPCIKVGNTASQKSNYRETMMTYPVFVTDRNTRVDFKNGIWPRKNQPSQKIRFINIAALNHHSLWAGATAAVKNYMGISDLSGGPDPRQDGRLTGNYYNFHSFAFDTWAPGPLPGALGIAIGTFMNTIRKADLNIITAEWTGLASRIHCPVAHTQTVLASTDPVALDYHAAKYVLYPNSRALVHNPDNTDSPLHQYLRTCAETTGYCFEPHQCEVRSFSWKTNAMEAGRDYRVLGKKVWGRDPKSLMKHLLMRYKQR